MENQDMEEVLKLLKSVQDEMKKKIKANKTMLAEMIARMDARREDMEASRNSWRKETMSYQETTEARLEEDKPASVDTTPEVVHEQEVPRENAIEMPVGEPRKRRRDRRQIEWKKGCRGYRKDEGLLGCSGRTILRRRQCDRFPVRSFLGDG
jgi:hypothetical protein